jgi:hypothetical protein
MRWLLLMDMSWEIVTFVCFFNELINSFFFFVSYFGVSQCHIGRKSCRETLVFGFLEY